MSRKPEPCLRRAVVRVPSVIAQKFGIFDHIEDIPGTPTSQLFQDRLTLVKMADEAGFHGYHLAEHHGSELCMAPGQELFIAAGSQITEQIRLGPMVKLLPMHHPIRIIEDMCVLDNLTGRPPRVRRRPRRRPDRALLVQPGLVGVPGPLHRCARDHRAGARDRGDLEREQPLLRLSDDADVDEAAPGRIPFWYPGSPVTAGPPRDEPDVAREDQRGGLRAVPQDVGRPQGRRPALRRPGLRAARRLQHAASDSAHRGPRHATSPGAEWRA